MRKLWAALAAVLSLVAVPAVIEATPASADSVCHVSSPQVNNVYFCAKASLYWNGSYYYTYWSLQTKSVGYETRLQVLNPNGSWLNCSSWLPYNPFEYGSWNGACGPLAWRPQRARVLVRNVYTGSTTSYSWNPFPPV